MEPILTSFSMVIRVGEELSPDGLFHRLMGLWCLAISGGTVSLHTLPRLDGASFIIVCLYLQRVVQNVRDRQLFSFWGTWDREKVYWTLLRPLDDSWKQEKTVGSGLPAMKPKAARSKGF
ncbi:hypothetical protein GSUB_08085 [Geoalkalibacter subterraneus]|uniref:Uncharacterized protein n=1 Tax=Geoalkalibacter subterraneus TaxID=483547 RepID=A0A0B5FGT0_9BACT|nr:hypothetical protein GSUB_08085 [Geoalkalibacter subterraneus]